MATLNDTAYPRLSRQIPHADLQRIYLLSHPERSWLDQHKYPDAVKLETAVMLKCFQRLGYFPAREDVPSRVVTFISDSVFGETHGDVVLHQRQSRRIKDAIRRYLNVQVYAKSEHSQWLYTFACEMAQTKESTVDIINAMTEQLVRDSIELPAFSTLKCIAVKARSSSLNSIYQRVSEALSVNGKRSLKQLLNERTDDGNTLWNTVKQEPRKPGINEIKHYIEHTKWLSELQRTIGRIPDIPEQIRQQCILEARAYSADRLSRVKLDKQQSLMAILINEQRLYANDCLADMFLKEIRKSHNVARKALQLYQLKSSAESASLVTLLRDIALTCTESRTDRATLKNIRRLLGGNPAQIAKRCDTLVQGGIDNYLHFLNVRYTKSNRKWLLDILETLEIKSIAKNTPLQACLEFILNSRDDAFYSINVAAIADSANLPASTLLSWVSRPWYKLLFANDTANLKNRKVLSVWLELCVLAEVSKRLRSGDLYIKNSIKYDDYRTHLVDRKTLKRELNAFCEESGLSPTASEFVTNLKQEFQTTAHELDSRFDENECVIFEHGRLSLKRPLKKQLPEGFEQLEALLKAQIPKISIVDLLVDTIKWIDMKPFFNPLSGHQGKITNFDRRIVATLFCYGCNLGPMQTARCIDGFSRKQIAYINLSNTSEQNLVDATEQVINAYNEFDLPGFWGSGHTASVDGPDSTCMSKTCSLSIMSGMPPMVVLDTIW